MPDNVGRAIRSTTRLVAEASALVERLKELSELTPRSSTVSSEMTG
jgi:hypothetical protein